MTHYASGMIWGEGPRWHNGSLWVSDTQGARLWTDASGTWTAIKADSVSNGLWFLPDGRLVAAMMHERRIGIWVGSKWETYADLSPLNPGPLGDIVGDRHGNLYVDDVAFSMAEGEPPRPGRLLFVGADGEMRVVSEGLEFPNGLTFLDDERTLIAAESSAQRLTSFHVEAPGDLSDRRLYADIAALVGSMARPDGIWATRDGVWVATLAGNAVALVRNGQLVTSIDTGRGCPIACCADDKSSRLFVTIADPGELGLLKALARKTVKTHVAAFDLDGLRSS